MKPGTPLSILLAGIAFGGLAGWLAAYAINVVWSGMPWAGWFFFAAIILVIFVMAWVVSFLLLTLLWRGGLLLSCWLLRVLSPVWPDFAGLGLRLRTNQALWPAWP
ncbi:MAG: hypothetical protein HY677_06135 [Chloroflexi bacterium]|nr:hypothetical protein [Chloroflexota bacterium]